MVDKGDGTPGAAIQKLGALASASLPLTSTDIADAISLLRGLLPIMEEAPETAVAAADTLALVGLFLVQASAASSATSVQSDASTAAILAFDSLAACVRADPRAADALPLRRLEEVRCPLSIQGPLGHTPCPHTLIPLPTGRVTL